MSQSVFIWYQKKELLSLLRVFSRAKWPAHFESWQKLSTSFLRELGTTRQTRLSILPCQLTIPYAIDNSELIFELPQIFSTGAWKVEFSLYWIRVF